MCVYGVPRDVIYDTLYRESIELMNTFIIMLPIIIFCAEDIKNELFQHPGSVCGIISDCTLYEIL